MKTALIIAALATVMCAPAQQSGIAKWDPNMAQTYAVTGTNGVKCTVKGSDFFDTAH